MTTKFTPGYEITRDGRVFSVSSNWRGYGSREMTQTLNADGYPSVRLVIDGKRTRMAVHRLVLEGWKLVPIEPTEKMLRVMTDPFIAINGDNRKAFESSYKAMLAAAPEITIHRAQGEGK